MQFWINIAVGYCSWVYSFVFYQDKSHLISLCMLSLMILGHFVLYLLLLKFTAPYNIVALGFLGTVFVLFGRLLKALHEKRCMNSGGSVWDTYVICFVTLTTFCSYLSTTF